MLDLELPFDPESQSRMAQAELANEFDANWQELDVSHLSSTLPIDVRPALVGRESDGIQILHALDAVARENAAVVVTVSGAPGIGKTRLIEDALVLAGVGGFEGRIFCVAAQPGDENHATIARLLRVRFGLHVGSDAYKRQCLRRRVAELFDDERVEDVCYFLGGLLGLAFEQTPLARALSSATFHAEVALQTIVCEIFAADSARAPLCLVVEDLHHLDAGSLGTLIALADDLRPGTLLIASARPEFFVHHEHFAEMGSATHEHIELGPLEEDGLLALLARVVGPCLAGEPELARYALEMAVGNPGTLQELVRELWAFGALQPSVDGKACLFDPQRLPVDAASVRASELERLAASSPLGFALLEIGALSGSVCWRGLWSALIRAGGAALDAEPREGEIDAALAALEAGGQLLRLPDSRIEGDVEYLFRFPEARSKLVERISSRRRKLLHRVAADYFAANEASVKQHSQLCELSAQHLASSGSGYRSALAYLQAAAAACAENSCLRAAQYFERGLEGLGEHDNRRRIDALHDYGAVLAALGRPSLAHRAFAEMLELAERLELHGKRGAALNRIGRVFRQSGELERARAHFELALSAFELAGDTRGVSATKDDLGKVFWLEGDRARALPLLREALDQRCEAGDPRSVAVSLANLALVWQDQGRTARSERALRIASDMFARAADQGGRCDALLTLGRVAFQRGDARRALALFQESAELAYQAKDRPRLARGLVQLGVAQLRADDLTAAETLLERARELALEIEAWLDLAEAERALAKLNLKRGEIEAARRHVCAALRITRRVRSRRQLAATLRTFAQVVAVSLRHDDARVVRYFMRSIELSKTVGCELEVAKGYRAFARYTARYQQPEIRRQTALLRDLSREIFNRYEGNAAACA